MAEGTDSSTHGIVSRDGMIGSFGTATTALLADFDYSGFQQPFIIYV
jgi:hypothetical protein